MGRISVCAVERGRERPREPVSRRKRIADSAEHGNSWRRGARARARATGERAAALAPHLEAARIAHFEGGAVCATRREG